MIRQGHFIAVVSTFLIGCVVLLVVSASGVRAETSQEENQGHTEATDTEQGHSGAAAPEGGDRCDQTRTISRDGAGYLTNDLPGCPNKGGLLSAKLPDTGTDEISSPKYGLLSGEQGDDEIRGSSTSDEIYAGDGNDVIYGASGGDFIVSNQGDDVLYGNDGNDYVLSGGAGKDVYYGGDGNDYIEEGSDGSRDKLYCGKGKDQYWAEKIDYVDSSCEKGKLVGTGGPPLLLFAGAAICSALIMLRYVIRFD